MGRLELHGPGETFLGSERVSREINRWGEGFSCFRGLPVFFI